MARAMLTRCSWPPESVWGYFSTNSAGGREFDLFEGVEHPWRLLCPVRGTVDVQWLRHQLPHAHVGAEAGERILEDGLGAAAEGEHGLAAEARDVLAFEDHSPVGCRHEPQGGPAERRLAAARLAHDRHRLSGGEVERDAGDRGDRPGMQERGSHFEPDREVLDAQHRPVRRSRLAHGSHLRPRSIRRHPPAARAVAGLELHVGRGRGTRLVHQWAAGREAAARDGLAQIRRRTPQEGRRARVVQARDARQQALGVGVGGCAEHLLGAPELAHLAGIDHGHLVTQVRRQGQVVGDEEHGDVAARLELLEQVHDLGLDAHVERAGGLVEDEQRRVVGQRGGDHHALLHAARQLMGIALGDRGGQTHLHQQLGHACPHLALAHARPRAAALRPGRRPG